MPAALMRVNTYGMRETGYRRIQQEQMKVKSRMKSLSAGGGKARPKY